MVHSNKRKILTNYSKDIQAQPVSNWKKLSSIKPIFYSQNGGSKAILSINAQNLPEVTLLLVNSNCDADNKTIKGESFMYVNKKLIKFGYVCSGNKESIFFAQSNKGKKYIQDQFMDKEEVCYAYKKEIKGLCFGAIGFRKSKSSLLKIQNERNSAI